MMCTPPFVDQVRGGVQAAWGDGTLTNYVLTGGLNPVDAVTSGVFLYPIAAFARIVAEDPSLQAAYGADAVRFANAGIQVFRTFAGDLYDHLNREGFVEGTFMRPAKYPRKNIECLNAHIDAINHLRDPSSPLSEAEVSELLPDIAKLRVRCDDAYHLANQPLAYNEAGSLLISFMELRRALDSTLYRSSPHRVADAALISARIAFAVARFQRYFTNPARLRVLDDPVLGPRYVWNYLDFVTESLDFSDSTFHVHVEDTSHSNFDMVFINSLRANKDRLDAATAPAGEPIFLNDGILRRFANTFVQKLAPPSLIDRGEDFRCRVDGDISCPKTVANPWVNNVSTDGWVQLSVVDPAVYRLVRDVVLRERVDEVGVLGQHEVTIGNHAALLANKRYARDVSYSDLTAASGSRLASSDPFGWVFASQDVQDISYRGNDGHVYELWRDDATGIGYTNLSGPVSAPKAAGNPKGYEYPSVGAHNVVYRGTDDHVHALWWTTGNVGHDNLTDLARAPMAAGNPFPFVVPAPYSDPLLAVQNVVYRGKNDGHIHRLFWTEGAVSRRDLTQAVPGVSLPDGDPVAYFLPNPDPSQAVQNVVYRGKDGRLHGLYWSNGPVGHDNYSAATGAPLPAGDPAVYTTPEGQQNIVYRGANGHIYIIYWIGSGAAAYEDLSAALSGAPLAIDNPEAYYSPEDRRHHIIYRTGNGHLHEISWSGAEAAAHADLTNLAPFIESATGKPSAYVIARDKNQHVVYRSLNGHLHELRWSTPIPDDIIILRAVPGQ
jgi:hypothetical protein